MTGDFPARLVLLSAMLRRGGAGEVLLCPQKPRRTRTLPSRQGAARWRHMRWWDRAGCFSGTLVTYSACFQVALVTRCPEHAACARSPCHMRCGSWQLPRRPVPLRPLPRPRVVLCMSVSPCPLPGRTPGYGVRAHPPDLIGTFGVPLKTPPPESHVLGDG